MSGIVIACLVSRLEQDAFEAHLATSSEGSCVTLIDINLREQGWRGSKAMAWLSSSIASSKRPRVIEIYAKSRWASEFLGSSEIACLSSEAAASQFQSS